MRSSMIRAGAVAMGIAAALGGFGEAEAQDREVVLKSFDGFTQLRGQLLDFTGDTFIIETRLGTLEIDALQVNCEGEACPEDLLFGAEFGIHGSNTIGDALMPSLIEGYADRLGASIEREIGAEENERVFRITHESGQEMAAIDLQAHGSGTSYPALADGRAVIGMSSRRMQDDEAVLLANVGIGELRDTENEHIVALDGLIVFVHPDNPIASLTLTEVAGLFSGQIANWADVGGPDMPVTLYARDAKSGTYDTFESLVLDPTGLALAEDANRFEDSAALSDAVAADPSGIGFTGFAYARAAKVLSIEGECGLISTPTTFNVKTEEYPLARRLYLYTSPQEKPAHAARLIDFAMSSDATPYVEEAGFISLDPESQGLNNQGVRLAHAITNEDEFSLELMQEMLRSFEGASRSSITFRFTPGSSELTAKSLRDAERLAQDIAAGVYDGREVMLVGFTDSIGQFDLNRQLAQRRANGVLELMAGMVAPGAFEDGVTAMGFGELTPVGCNTTFAGRVLNRRVEVWIR